MGKTGERHGLPARQGMYDPRWEREACGIGFVAHLRGVRSHEIVAQGLQALQNLSHRGATGCDPCTCSSSARRSIRTAWGAICSSIGP
jgi:hypothetical protein